MEKCPVCGGTSGVYTRDIQVWEIYQKWDGEPDGGEPVESECDPGDAVYCRDCGSYVAGAAEFAASVVRRRRSLGADVPEPI